MLITIAKIARYLSNPNEENIKFEFFLLLIELFSKPRVFPFYIFHTCSFGSKIIISLGIYPTSVKVNNKNTFEKMSRFFSICTIEIG